MAEENKKYTPISELGEFGLIHRLSGKIELHRESTLKGIGDDAAVIAPPGKDEVILLSTDMMAEGIHFDLAYTPLRHLGYKAVAVNVSDICAMNGEATQFLVSIALSNQYSVETIEEIYEGMRFACKEYNVDLVGGNTSSSRSGLIISISIIGKGRKDNIAYRNGAKAGDLLCVTGDLGAAYAGLFLLEKGKKDFALNPSVKPDLKGYNHILQRQLMPHARMDVINMFADSGVKPSAMIDVSDGLSSEINHLCEDSVAGCLLDEDKIPIHEETIKVAHGAEVSPTLFALNGGEDYQLLFTLPPAEFKKLKDTSDITVIGEMLPPADGIKLAGKDGNIQELTSKGWDGMKKK
ncbi:MAG: thiamine-phosphate kinase [Bacteroidia bacterium]|jgi:thiamine-monophosphate kinase|nr:thiamine-phosphate kinase [Bacteroidia bacterium]